MRGDMNLSPSETDYFQTNCVKVAMLVSQSSFFFFAMMHLRSLGISFCLIHVLSLLLCRVQFARSDAQREGLDQTVLRNVSATTGANVTPKPDCASVLKVSLATGVYVQVCHAAAFYVAVLYCRSINAKGHLLPSLQVKKQKTSNCLCHKLVALWH